MRTRIFTVLLISLLGVLLAAWGIAGGGIIRPFISKVSERRTKVVHTLATEVEESDRPKIRLKRLSSGLELHAELKTKPPRELKRRATYFRSGTRTFYVIRNSSIWITEVTLKQKEAWLVIRFPLDLTAPNRRIGAGLFMLAICAALAAWSLAKWSIQPLEEASGAMEKIASGELSHRVENPIGPAASSFNRMADRLEELVEGQRDLMASISHELRTPITRLRLQAELRGDDSMLEDLAELEDLVATMLESAKLKRGVVALSLSWIDLEDLWMEAIGKLQLERIEFRHELRRTRVFADRHLFLRLCINLLSNIKRYAPEGTVWLAAEEQERGTRLSIRDSGQGVPEELLPRIFDPFTRAEKSRAKVSGGLGLGLLLVHQIIEAHSGEVKAYNHSEGGLVLEMWFPSPVLDETS